MLPPAVLLVKSLPSSSIFPHWIAIWLVVSSIICTWDASFIFLRPKSFTIPLWAPYIDYVQVDKLYADMDDNFVWCQSIMNLAEVFLNGIALTLLKKEMHNAAGVVAIVTSSMTCSKTILYHLIEFACGFCNTSQNDLVTFAFLYLLPNGVWICVPAIAIFQLGKSMTRKDYSCGKSV